jgi:hypothetical protein
MLGLGIIFPDDIQRYILNDRAHDKLSGNKDWYEMQAFVEFRRSNIAENLLVI